MPCTPLKIGDTYGFICSRGSRQRCFYCGGRCERLCDFPVGERLKKPKKRADGSERWFRECDRPMCAGCAQKVYTDSEFDFCREHFPQAKAAYERKKIADRLRG